MNIIFKGNNNVVGPDVEPCGQCDQQGLCGPRCYFRNDDIPGCTCLWSKL